MLNRMNRTRNLVAMIAAGATFLNACGGGGASSAPAPPVLKSIVITPNSVTSGVGVSQQLTATGTYSDATTRILTDAANWVSSTPTVATVSPTTGLATGVAVGTTNISATIGAVTASASLSIVTHTWVVTGNMRSARAGHTATLLLDGTALVAGGYAVYPKSLVSAELFNPATGAWNATDSMMTGRWGHTATLLPNGTVLVAGGTDINGNTLASSELYNPATGAWTTTGSMTTPRSGNSATLLLDGTVLVAGGTGPNGSTVPSPEIYNPTTGVWTATSSMTYGLLSGQTATLMPDGTVLVAGGTVVSSFGTSPVVVASSSNYDPTAGMWTATANMAIAQENQTATLLLDGTVLIAGGGVPCGIGDLEICSQSSAEIYDPSTASWTMTGSMTTQRLDQTGTLLADGNVLIAGGLVTDGITGSALGSTELYNPAVSAWTDTGSMTTPRFGATATLLAVGSVLVAGGNIDESLDSTQSTEIYYP
jgi:hypothetical protein